jgi:flagellar assembly protein FliH
MSYVNIHLNKKVKGFQNTHPPIIFGRTNSEDKIDEIQKQQTETNPLIVAENKANSLKGKIEILERELQNAKDESFKAGYEEGKNAAKQEAEKQLELLRIDMKALEIKYLEAIENLEAPLLDISKEIALKIIDKEIENPENNDEILMNRLRKMMYEVFEQNKALIEIEAMHLDNISEKMLKEEFNLPQKMEINIKENNTLKPGEAIISAEDFSIDGRYESAADHLRQQLEQEDPQ